MKIREVKKSELKEVAFVMKKVFNSHPYNDKWTDKSSFERIKDEFSKNKIFVSLINGKIVGGISVGIEIGFDGGVGSIRELFVLKKYRENKIGSMLVEFSEQYFKKKKCLSVYLQIYSKSKAVDFYKNNGYKIAKNTSFLIKKFKSKK